MRGISRTSMLMHGFVPETIRIHVSGMKPGTTFASSNGMRRTDSDAGAFRNSSLIDRSPLPKRGTDKANSRSAFRTTPRPLKTERPGFRRAVLHFANFAYLRGHLLQRAQCRLPLSARLPHVTESPATRGAPFARHTFRPFLGVLTPELQRGLEVANRLADAAANLFAHRTFRFLQLLFDHAKRGAHAS